MKRKLHVLSNAPWVPSGYGNQMSLFLWQLKENGYDVAFTTNFGLQGAPLNFNDITFYPVSHEMACNDVIVSDFYHSKSQLLFILYDSWVMQNEITSQVPTAIWTPVDHDPITKGVIEALSSVAFPIAMSKHGFNQMLDAGIKDAYYIPHAYSAKQYYPQDKKAIRERLGIPQDAFVFCLVAANKGTPSRKNFDQQLQAFAALSKQHDDAFLLLHTDVLGLNSGENLLQQIELFGVNKKRVILPDTYAHNRGFYTASDMRDRYNASDVLLHCTKGEGFGVTQIEAMACGLPVIATDFTAMTEIVGDTGWLVEPSSLHWTPQGSFQASVSASDVLERMRLAYNATEIDNMGKLAHKRVKTRYEAKHVFKAHFLTTLQNIYERLGYK